MKKSKKVISAVLIVLALLLLTTGTIFVIGNMNSVGTSAEDMSSDDPVSSEPPVSSEEIPVSSEPEIQDAYATLTFSGDVLIHKSVFTSAHQEDGSYDFSPYFSLVEHVFDSDINMVNMEGPVDVHGNNKNIDTYPCFNAPIEILDALKGVGINTLITSNNHSYDKGWNGCVMTRRNIVSKGFDPIGTYETQEQADTPYVKDVNGIKIGMVAFTDSTNGIKISKEYSGFALNHVTLDDKGIEQMLDKIKQLHDAGAEYIITLFHWGAEYIDAPLDGPKKVSQALAENGVDLIIGNHSHCVQPIEKKTVTYKGKEKECLVIYSLGNFFVNQTALNKPKTQYGMVVKVKIKKDVQGELSLDAASYSPTFMYHNPEAEKEDAFRVMIAGEYANATVKPDFFRNDADWEKAAKAVEHVKKVVGNDIECREVLTEVQK